MRHKNRLGRGGVRGLVGAIHSLAFETASFPVGMFLV